MNFSVLIDQIVIVDLRLVPVIINSFFFGGLPAFITGIIITVGRLIFGNRTDVYIYSYLYAVISISQLLLMPVLKYYSGTKRLIIIFLSVIIPTVFTITCILDSVYFFETIVIVIYMILGTIICHYLILELQRSQKNFIYFEKMSKIDFLTGLPNRFSYDKNSERLFKSLDQPVVWLFLLDINHFKPINDTYGHDIGDLTLKLFSAKLNLQPYIKNHIYRLGGDEFAILLTDYSKEEIVQIAENIRKKILEIDIQVEGQKIDISASIGISNSQKVSSPVELYKFADIQLYEDKEKYRTAYYKNSTLN